MTREKIFQVIKENNIESIDFKYADLSGRWYHISFPVERFDIVLEKGISFDGSSIPGMKAVEAGDLIILPELETAWVEPFWDKPTLSFVANVYDADTRIGIRKDPRSVAIRALQYMNQTGVADDSRWGPEIEFYLFDSAQFYSGDFSAYYSFTSSQSAESLPLEEISPYAGQDRKGYHLIHPFDHGLEMREDAVAIAKQAGVKIRYHHAEVGLGGQQEIELERMGLLKAADSVFLLKHILRNLAFRRKKFVTFMPKPLYNQPGNGLHFHIQLIKNKENLFYEEGKYANLSDIAIHFIIGVLKHTPALTIFTNSSTNSYKRLVPGFEAPIKLLFGLANRSAALRIPKYAVSKDDKRIEFRPADATCNPYLAMSAILMAGIDGVQKKYALKDFPFGPYDDNVFNWPEEKREKLLSLPLTLEEAIDALQKDKDFLFQGNVFDDYLITDYLMLKRDEAESVHDRPHPYEMVLYFNL